LVSGCVSSVAGAVAVVVTRLSAQRTDRIRMRLAAELDREHVQMVMRVHEQRAAGGLAAAAGAGGVAVVSWPAPDRADLGGWAGGDAYAGRVSGASEAAMRLLAEIVSDRLHGPHLLYEAWVAGRVCDGDLRELIPGTWLYVDWPERIIGTGKWVRLFRAAGFFAIPYGLARPAGAVTLYRGASAGRRAGMSWTTDPGRADQFRQRHSWHAPTAVYRAVATPEAVLALLERSGEGPPEVVVDPQMLTHIEQVTPLHPQRYRQDA
jgi:hypothetical protein